MMSEFICGPDEHFQIVCALSLRKSGKVVNDLELGFDCVAPPGLPEAAMIDFCLGVVGLARDQLGMPLDVVREYQSKILYGDD